MRQLAGVRFEVTLDARGQAVKLAGYDLVLTRLAQENPVTAKRVRALLTEESFKVAIEDLFGFIPEKAVVPGETWERKSLLRLGPLGTITLENRYTLREMADALQVARVDVTTKADYKPAPLGLKPSLKITAGKVRLLKSSGQLWVNVACGRLVRSESKHTLQVTLQLHRGEARTEMDLHQEQSRTIHILDKR